MQRIKYIVSEIPACPKYHGFFVPFGDALSACLTQASRLKGKKAYEVEDSRQGVLCDNEIHKLERVESICFQDL